MVVVDEQHIAPVGDLLACRCEHAHHHDVMVPEEVRHLGVASAASMDSASLREMRALPEGSAIRARNRLSMVSQLQLVRAETMPHRRLVTCLVIAALCACSPAEPSESTSNRGRGDGDGGAGAAGGATSSSGGGDAGGSSIEPGVHFDGTSAAATIGWLDGVAENTTWNGPNGTDATIGELRIIVEDKPDLCTDGDFQASTTIMEIYVWDSYPLEPGDFVVAGPTYEVGSARVVVRAWDEECHDIALEAMGAQSGTVHISEVGGLVSGTVDAIWLDGDMHGTFAVTQCVPPSVSCAP